MSDEANKGSEYEYAEWAIILAPWVWEELGLLNGDMKDGLDVMFRISKIKGLERDDGKENGVTVVIE